MFRHQFNIRNNNQKKEIGVIGSGVIGSTTAWYLARHGYQVTIVDKALNSPIDYSTNLSGTNASLGILMGYIFRRSSGRSWRLRKRSMELWPHWVKELATKEIPLVINTPLVQLASSIEEKQFMIDLVAKRKHLGLSVLAESSSHNLSRIWPDHEFGGLISHQDGRIDPTSLMECLKSKLTTLKVKQIKAKVNLVKRDGYNSKTWLIQLENKEAIAVDAVVICAANGTEPLINPLGYSRPIEPILGQVLNLNSIEDKKSWDGWPAVLSCHGVNLIPYKSNQFFLGATIEPGMNPNKIAIDQMTAMKGNCPDWINASKIKNKWRGVRAKPSNKPAPLLESLEDGLILNTAHYRNGILLAPACAEWVGNEILKTIISSQ